MAKAQCSNCSDPLIIRVTAYLSQEQWEGYLTASPEHDSMDNLVQGRWSSEFVCGRCEEVEVNDD